MRASKLQRAILVATDAAVIGISLLLVIELTRLFSATNTPPQGVLEPAAIVACTLVWLITLGAFSAYSLKNARAGATEFKRVANATVVAGAVIGVTSVLLSYPLPPILFIAWFGAGLLWVCGARLLRRMVMRQLHARELFVTPVLVAGSPSHIDEIAHVLDRENWIGFRIEGAITDTADKITQAGVPVLGKIAHLPEIVSDSRSRVIIFAEGSFGSRAGFRRLAWQLERSNAQMIIAPTLADVSEDRLEFNPIAGLPLVHVGNPTAVKSLRWVKRAVDIVGSATVLLMSSPFWLTAMLAIKLEDGGPVFFSQRRVGLEGREFNCYKLRSMCLDAEARLAELQAKSEGNRVMFKMKHDPRVTRVGRFIRRYSIDELPQLWNIVRGDMSLVGPRPALPQEVERYDEDARRRLRVRPGLTGLWQVSGRSRLSWENTVRLDLYYVDNWSFWQDFSILTKTLRAVIRSTGAY